MSKVLIVDDEVNILKSLKELLEDYNLDVITLSEPTKLFNVLNTEDIDVILLDLLMPEVNGIDVLREVRKQFPLVPVIIISGHGTIQSTVECIKIGAFDFLEKPISIEALISSVTNALRLRELEIEKNEYWSEYKLIGVSKSIKDILNTIENLSYNDATVLITGENGVGKEVVARLIHQKSNRKQGPFVDVNCAAIPETLIEAELFGYERGAFTGAITSKKGKFEAANNGTLFLDEIGDMPLNLQSKLLRVLQEKAIQRLGSNKNIPVNIRLICSTNKDIAKMVKEGIFREDLYYRINVIPIHIPPLRDRKEDIPELIKYYIKEFSKKYGKKFEQIEDKAIDKLVEYKWPGNVRELKNIVERLVIMSNSKVITLEDMVRYIPEIIDNQDRNNNSEEINWDLPYKEAKQYFEKIYFTRKLAKVNNNISKLSQETGLDRTYIYKKLENLGINVEKND